MHQLADQADPQLHTEVVAIDLLCGARRAPLTGPVDPRGTTRSAGIATKIVQGPYFNGAGFFTVRQYDVSPAGQKVPDAQGGRRYGPDRRDTADHRREELQRLVASVRRS